jgi:hypothetical protein
MIMLSEMAWRYSFQPYGLFAERNGLLNAAGLPMMPNDTLIVPVIVGRPD